MAEKEKMNYVCRWCGFAFSRNVGKSISGEGDKGHSNVSSQVICPNCGHFIPTWG